MGTPILPASADFKNASRKTMQAYFTEVLSSSSFKLLISTGAQKWSIALCVCPLRRSHAKKSSLLSSGTPLTSPSNARAIASLSPSESSLNCRNEIVECSGAGSHEGSMQLERPPGSINVIRSYQRILSSTPSRR